MGSVTIASPAVPDLTQQPRQHPHPHPHPHPHHHPAHTMLSAGLNNRAATPADSVFSAAPVPASSSSSHPAVATAATTNTNTAVAVAGPTAFSSSSNSNSRLHHHLNASNDSNSNQDHHHPRSYPSQHAQSSSSSVRDSMTSEASSSHARLPDRHRSSSSDPAHPNSHPHHHHHSSSSSSHSRSLQRDNDDPSRLTVASPSAQPSPNRIKVRDLSHIQSFASEEMLAPSPNTHATTATTNTTAGMSGHAASRFPGSTGRQYEISSMPVTDIIEMVAGLLTKITTTNDQQHEHIHRNIPPPEGAGSLPPQTSSVLAFHGKNVPIITILNYLTRIHKYCPTTYEVFLSLLVYFDRMTESVNNRLVQQLQQRRRRSEVKPDQDHPMQSPSYSPDSSTSPSLPSSHSGSSSISTTTHFQSTLPLQQHQQTSSPSSSNDAGTVRAPSTGHGEGEHDIDDIDNEDPLNFSHYFVVDSFNIHRLAIAGVTCASKFFSDVFYTNSRYAKVGGLPLLELNHLELQFLILNDFRLAVPVEELEAYGTMLVEFYAREIVTQQGEQRHQPNPSPATGLNATAASVMQDTAFAHANTTRSSSTPAPMYQGAA